MRVHPSRDRIQLGSIAELATSPHVVVPLGSAPDGLPWLLRVDRSRELSTLFTVVPRVFGLTRREDLPQRVRDALERDVAAGLMGVHELEVDGQNVRGFVARKKLKHLIGPTLFAQLLDARTAPYVEDEGRHVSTNVGAMAARDDDEEVLAAVDRSIDAFRSKRHLLLDLAKSRAYSCSVREADRALRVPSAPVRPLAFESLLALGGVEATVWTRSGTWTASLSDAAGLHAALVRAHQSDEGGWLRYDIPRQQLLAQLVQVARDVDQLHRSGHVHADLAPGNVLVCTGGARAFDGLELEAGSPATAATFEWAAPEQIVGHGVDPRTDVYALGRMATALIGAVMFGEQTEYVVPIGGDASRHVKLLKGEGVFLDATKAGHDRAWQRAWQELLGRAIHFDRERRQATAGAFADELADVLERYAVASRITLEARFGDLVPVESPSGVTFAHLAVD